MTEDRPLLSTSLVRERLVQAANSHPSIVLARFGINGVMETRGVCG